MRNGHWPSGKINKASVRNKSEMPDNARANLMLETVF